MAILVVGSVALDTVKTPFGQVEDVLGGAVSFFALAASLYDRVNMVAVVGEDFPRRYIDEFRARNIDTRGPACHARQDVPLGRRLSHGYERARHALH